MFFYTRVSATGRSVRGIEGLVEDPIVTRTAMARAINF
jgi:hypothetical protein